MPRFDDQLGYFYFELQKPDRRTSAPAQGQNVWRRWCVTFATTVYVRWQTPQNVETFEGSIRVRAVGFPDANGDVEASAWAYPKKQTPVTLLRATV